MPGSPASPPIDIDHLARQTLQDATLQREILALFDRQIVEFVREIDAGTKGKDLTFLTHRLVGTARNLGAFELAQRAAELEEGIDNPNARQALEQAISELRSWLAAQMN